MVPSESSAVSNPCVFVSYSGTDENEVRPIVEDLEVRLGRRFHFYYWGESRVPGEEDWASIFRWIRGSQLLLAFILKHEERDVAPAIEDSLSVGAEIGYALSVGVTVVPITNLFDSEAKRLGPAAHLVRLPYHDSDPKEVANRIADHLELVEAELQDALRVRSRATERLANLTYVFGERFHSEVDPTIEALSRRVWGNGGKARSVPLAELRDYVLSHEWPFARKDLLEVHVAKYRALLSVCSLFQAGFAQLLERYARMGILESRTSDILHDITEELDAALEPLLWYEVPDLDGGGVPRGQARPTDRAIRLIGEKSGTQTTVIDSILSLYEEYRRTYVHVELDSLHKNWIQLAGRLLEGRAFVSPRAA